MLFMLALAPRLALAGCAPGQTPGYDDIRRIEFRRFALVGRSYPRFTADFRLDLTHADPAALSAQLIAQANVPIIGTFTEHDPHTFLILRRVLERDRFYDLHLTPIAASYLDGPRIG